MNKSIPKNVLIVLIIVSNLLPSVLYGQAGSLDLSFDIDGKVTTDVGAGFDDYGSAMALQTDGKIVVVGRSGNSAADDFALTRYNTDGSLDNTFDTDGKVTTPIGINNDQASAIAIQADGKIVVAGYSFNGLNYDFAVVRYNGNGSLDNTFDTDGKVTTAVGSSNDYGYSIALQTDGKIVVAGYSRIGGTDDFAVVRYNADGSLDNSFDTDGKVTTAIGASDDQGTSMAIQADGKIVVSGSSFGVSYTAVVAVVRYNADGSLDNSFDTDGKVTTAVGVSNNDYGFAIALQADGKIVVAGQSLNFTSIDILVVRYNSDGSLDNSFDTDGKVTTDIGVGSWDYGNAIAIQADGRILVAGQSFNDTIISFTVVRYNSNGSLDNTFDTDGKVTTSIGASNASGKSIVLQTDGKIVVGGFSFDGITYEFAVVRYLGASTALPINLYSFTGKNTINGNEINWITASEQNNEYFFLQRCNDATHFENIASIRSKAENGNSNTNLFYTYIDNMPLIENNYYRLKQVDKDGKSTLSNIVKITNSLINTIPIYPNPATNEIQLSSIKNVKSIKILSLDGKEIMYLKDLKNNMISVQHLANGQYLLLVEIGSITTTFRFEKI